MVKKSFELIPVVSGAEDERDEVIKEYYSNWRKTNSDSNTAFIPLFKGFRQTHLATLEPGALRLYLFFAFAADNNYGNSWYSIEKIAEFFNAQTRTVNNWIKVLVEKNLIIREQKSKRSFTTYLVPYSNTIIKHQIRREIRVDKQDLLDFLLKKVANHESLYGPVIGVFHFFQWKIKKKKLTKDNWQWLFIITKREDGILTGHIYNLKNSNHLGVDEMIIDNDGGVATFESPFKYKNLSIRGLALTHEIRLNQNTGALLKLMEDLSKVEAWDWDEHSKFQYGEIAEMYNEEDAEEQEITIDVAKK